MYVSLTFYKEDVLKSKSSAKIGSNSLKQMYLNTAVSLRKYFTKGVYGTLNILTCAHRHASGLGRGIRSRP